jgi:hypothetical protein
MQEPSDREILEGATGYYARDHLDIIIENSYSRHHTHPNC